MVICAVPDLTAWLVDSTHWIDTLQSMQWHLPIDVAFLDEPLRVDLAGDVQKAFNNFVKTGQVWAFLIGLILGYLVRSFTTYG